MRSSCKSIRLTFFHIADSQFDSAPDYRFWRSIIDSLITYPNLWIILNCVLASTKSWSRSRLAKWLVFYLFLRATIPNLVIISILVRSIEWLHTNLEAFLSFLQACRCFRITSQRLFWNYVEHSTWLLVAILSLAVCDGGDLLSHIEVNVVNVF